VGFPIRKSADQSSFAAPRGLSQRSTSFIASQRQGIHQTPLRHLIALIINAHRRDQKSVVSNQGILPDFRLPTTESRQALTFERPACEIGPTAGGQAPPTCSAGRLLRGPARARVLANSLERIAGAAALGSISSSRCQIARVPGLDAARQRENSAIADEHVSRLVEPDGIEPTTSCLQSRRSPN
jgi:hypothetical protein